MTSFPFLFCPSYAEDRGRRTGASPSGSAPRDVPGILRKQMELGAAIGAPVTERAWELPAAGATHARSVGGHRPGAGRVRRGDRLRRRHLPAHRVAGVVGRGHRARPARGPQMAGAARPTVE
ncbi:hypothetical protein [Streptomyces sp. CB01373]|uniref:hypothetical protein n=1 Tax=Streptomyces sp. CB01373 TaxID=2020325 RepID=UPI001F2AB1C9|nr:hypothetical protein [Streptomyces sp. CB01373]